MMKGKIYHLGIRNNPGDNMLESAIEAKMRKAVQAMGGECDKIISPSRSGYPDRLVQINGHKIWVELKTSKGTLRKEQKIAHELITDTGNDVYVTYGISGLMEFLEVVKRANKEKDA